MTLPKYPPPPEAIAGRCFTKAILADEFQLARSTVASRLREAGVPSRGWESRSEVYRLRDVVGPLTGRDTQPTGDAYDLTRFSSASERKAAIEGDLKLAELRKINGELVPRGEVVVAMAAILSPAVALLAGLSSRLETDLGVSDENLLTAVDEWERNVRLEMSLAVDQALQKAKTE